ncbi:hypothetical protein GWK47_037664 [Chionoecetes opilio]|uniref:Uncharacterized protein n=1 Tax=Chionoecetes opilio TaxID=41210 RepID=A0A8J4YMX1_CHIOP|nr:hypothetical protein GWK47_037664 [Chionoecetes opilio]
MEGMEGSSDDLRHLPIFREEKNNIPEWQKVKLLLSSCFNFSCEGNFLLDDENISCLEESPDSKESEVCYSRSISDLTCSESVVCDDNNDHGTLSCITSPEIHATNCMIQDRSLVEWEKDKLYPDIKKQSCKSYNSFHSSPSLEGITDTSEVSLGSTCLVTASDELLPLISKCNSVFYETAVSVTNDYDCEAKKDKFYNKVLPFPISTKSLGALECSGAVNSLVKFDDDTNSHSVSLNYNNYIDCKGDNLSVYEKPIIAKDTMILCNDLDSDCQVIPLSFSPNVYPDMGTVPQVNCQVSMNKSVPPGTLVTSSCNSLVTLLSKTKDSIHPASWPRRRPQSLRIAMCYSNPEHLQANVENPLSSVNLQEIALEDLSTNSLEDCSRKTNNILSSIISSKNLAMQRESKLNWSINKSLCEKEKLSVSEICIKNENSYEIMGTKPADDRDITLSSRGGDSLQTSDICKRSSVESVTATETNYRSNNALLYPFIDATQNYGELEEWAPRSPSSDKENDPAMLSVRPKMKNNHHHSPKKKKTSPVKKNKSPRKTRYDFMKEIQPKTLLPQKCENSNKNGSLSTREEDIWAVDDFLPVAKYRHSHFVEQQDNKSKLPLTLVVKNSPCGFEVKSGSKSENIKDTITPHFDDMDFSMMNSTFSTDTGYETETHVNSVSTDDCVTFDEVHQSKEITFPSSKTQSNIVPDTNVSLCVPSAHSTPINVSGPTTPNTVTDDLSEYYSICSELTNLINASNNISFQKEVDDDTPGYFSISSELPGVSRQPEDSPSTDLDLQQCFIEDNKTTEPPDSSPKPNQASHNCGSHIQDSLINREPSKAFKCPASQDPLSPTEDVSGEKTLSAASSNSPVHTLSQELVEVKYVQLSLTIALAIVLHAMQSISQFMLEIFLATEQEDRWD